MDNLNAAEEDWELFKDFFPNAMEGAGHGNRSVERAEAGQIGGRIFARAAHALGLWIVSEGNGSAGEAG